MAPTKKHELELQLSDDLLITSLGNIKTAIKTIWTPNIFIIRDFTDHGEEHSFNVLNNAKNLLKILMNSEKEGKLSDIELYLLLACAYLHDVGMQCDIAKFPEVKTLAELLGADFEGIKFDDVDYSSCYSLTQQIIIRKNHQYLTAAWINHARNNSDPSFASELDGAIKSIPPLLIQSITDICKYHSGKKVLDMDFMECRQDRRARIGLVAALLRLADELDIDLYRVPEPEKISRNFRLPPENLMYWWLHGRTHIYIKYRYNKEAKPTMGIIDIDFVLHPEDKKEHCKIVQEKVIERFKDKNQKIFKILSRYGIPIFVSDESGVSEDPNLERIPSEIWRAIYEI